MKHEITACLIFLIVLIGVSIRTFAILPSQNEIKATIASMHERNNK